MSRGRPSVLKLNGHFTLATGPNADRNRCSHRRRTWSPRCRRCYPGTVMVLLNASGNACAKSPLSFCPRCIRRLTRSKRQKAATDQAGLLAGAGYVTFRLNRSSKTKNGFQHTPRSTPTRPRPSGKTQTNRRCPNARECCSTWTAQSLLAASGRCVSPRRTRTRKKRMMGITAIVAEPEVAAW